MKLIPCGKRFTEIDDSDFDAVSQFTWCVDTRSDGKDFRVYRYIKTSKGKYKKEKLHDFLMKPQGCHVVCHKDGNGLNNQRYNLLCGTKQQSSFNARKQDTGKYPYKGVSRVSLIHGKYQPGKPWKARIRCNGKLITIGYFMTIEDAALAYNKKAVELFQEFAVINEKIENPGTYVDPMEVTDRDIKSRARAAKHIADHGTPCLIPNCSVVALKSHGLCYIHGSHQGKWARDQGQLIGWNVEGWLAGRGIRKAPGGIKLWRKKKFGVNCHAKRCKETTTAWHHLCDQHSAICGSWAKARSKTLAEALEPWLSIYKPRAVGEKCIVDECQKIVGTATGLCRKHHNRRDAAKNQFQHAAMCAEHTERRRFRKAKAGVFVITKRDLGRLMYRQSSLCYICSVYLVKPQIDHIIPLARGGRHSIGNLAISCAKCNLKKNDRLLSEFKHGITSYRYRVKRKLAAKAMATVAA